MKLLQIRNVPDDLHRTLKSRATLAGTSLSEYALAELRRSAERPTREEILDRIAGRPATHLARPPADAVPRRAGRDVIVLDASAVVELLLNTAGGRGVAARIADPDETLHAPHLLGVEVGQVLRRYTAEGSIVGDTAVAGLRDLLDLDIERYDHEPLLPRAWELRRNVTVYDGVYVALAEVLAAPLLTFDRRLAAAPGIRASVELLT